MALPRYELSLFAGAGGSILGGHLCGRECVGAVEIEDYPRKVLLQRQRDGILPWFPIWDDIATFRQDNSSTREYIEWLISIRCDLLISGGFPCQDISAAGAVHGYKQGFGLEGSRSGLWTEMARIIFEVRPRVAQIENSPLLVSRGLSSILCDLSEMGYDARWGIMGANSLSAPHKRERCWVVANSSGFGMEGLRKSGCLTKDRPWGAFRAKDLQSLGIYGTHEGCGQSPLLRMDDGMAHWVDRIKAIGNGQVPAVACLAYEILAK